MHAPVLVRCNRHLMVYLKDFLVSELQSSFLNAIRLHEGLREILENLALYVLKTFSRMICNCCRVRMLFTADVLLAGRMNR